MPEITILRSKLESDKNETEAKANKLLELQKTYFKEGFKASEERKLYLALKIIEIRHEIRMFRQKLKTISSQLQMLDSLGRINELELEKVSNSHKNISTSTEPVTKEQINQLYIKWKAGEIKAEKIRKIPKKQPSPIKKPEVNFILNKGVKAEEFSKKLVPIKSFFKNFNAQTLDGIEDSNMIFNFRNSEPAPEKSDPSILKPYIKASMYGVDVGLHYVKNINISLVHNDIPIVEDFSIENTSFNDIKNIMAGLWVSPDYSDSYETSILSIPVGTKVELSNITPPFYFNRLKQVIEAEKAMLRLELTVGSRKIFTESYPVRIMPYNEWYIGPEYSFAETIASFIYPNDSPEKPAVETIISHAVERLKMSVNETSFDGYQSNDPGKVIAQAAAIFEAIQHDIGLTYIYPPASFEFTGQKVLSPWQVITNRRGTCLDTTVLLAACFERIGLHSVVFLINGHAFVGFWILNGLGLVSNGIQASKTNDISIVKNAIEQAYIIPIESTLIADKKFKFENAIATWVVSDSKGEAFELKLPAERFHCMVDIFGCRMNGIKPMSI